MPRIVITDATFSNFDSEEAVAARYGAELQHARCTSEQEVVDAASNTDVLLVQFAKLTRRAVERLSPKALVVRYGIGLDNIDLEAAKKHGIKVAYVPDYATGEVADHTVSLILTQLRKIVSLDQSVREGKWDAVGVSAPVLSFSETTVGFLGFGRIGREVQARLRVFGFKTNVCDPYVEIDALAKLGAQSVGLDDLFSTSDVITLHAPLTPTTRHTVSAKRIDQMKSSAIIVNTSRGGLIDTSALETALFERKIAGAALDVFEQEPLPTESRLRHVPNLLLTPHAAWYSTRSAKQLQALAADEVDRHLSGRPCRCPAPLQS
jgi:D-3-phosphoglycerate dehydrogenase / 2-oxoglutarate reductase